MQYQIINQKTGESFIVSDLKAFCAEHELDYQSMLTLANGVSNRPYKGYKAEAVKGE